MESLQPATPRIYGHALCPCKCITLERAGQEAWLDPVIEQQVRGGG